MFVRYGARQCKRRLDGCQRLLGEAAEQRQRGNTVSGSEAGLLRGADDIAGDLGARSEGKLWFHLVKAAGLEYLGERNTCCPHPNQYLIVARLGAGEVDHLDRGRPVV